MKKALPVIIILVLAGLGLWYFLQPSATTVSPVSLLPENTMAVVRFFDLEKSIEQLQTGNMAEKLKEIDLEAVMAGMDMPEDNLEDMEDGIDDFQDTVNSEWFKELFGQDVMLAMLPVSIKEFTPRTFEDLVAHFVVVARPKHRAEALGFISSLVTDETTVESIAYGNHEIEHVTVEEDVQVYYCLVDGMLVGTLAQKTLQECLDRIDQHSPSLADNERYVEMINKVERPDAKMVCYIDAEALYGIFSKGIAAQVATEEQRTPVAHSMSSMKGLTDIGSAFYDDGTEILETKAVVSFNKAALDPLYAKIYSFAPVNNKTLAMAAGEPLLYYWTNLLDFQRYWDVMTQNESMEEQDRAALEENVQQQLGVSSEALFAALGNQLAVTVTDINTSGFFPIPKLVLFMEARDPQVIEGIIASAVKKTMVQFQLEEYKGITIRSLPLPFGADLQPAYAFLNGFCLISINTQLIRDAIDTNNSGEGLTKDPDFTAVDRGLSGKNNTVCFLNVTGCIDASKDIIEWQQKMAMFKDPENAQQRALVMEKVVYPILESLQVVETIGTRIILNENEMEGYSYIKVDRGGDGE